MAQIATRWTLIGPDQVHLYVSQVRHLFIHLKGHTCLTCCVCASVCVYGYVSLQGFRHTQVFFDEAS